MAVVPLLLTVYEEDGGCVLHILLTVDEEDGGCVAYNVDSI